MSVAEIYMGVEGLANSLWAEDFFPPDLPTDWVLDYYANEFDVISLGLKDRDLLLQQQEFIETQEQPFWIFSNEIENIGQLFANPASSVRMEFLHRLEVLDVDLSCYRSESRRLVFFLDYRQKMQAPVLKQKLQQCVQWLEFFCKRQGIRERVASLIHKDSPAAIANIQTLKIISHLMYS